MADLTGSVAVVTGASSGLGRHFAHLLALHGAHVALAARRTDRLETEVQAIEAKGGRAAAFALDVADAREIPRTLDTVEAKLGPIDILVNNAGIDGAGAALDIDVERFDTTFAVNTRAVFVCAREAAKRMITSGAAAAGKARIINIASIAAFEALPGLSAYCASKAAVVSLTKSFAREWARHNIAVNALCPGYIESEINADWFSSEPGRKQIAGFARRRLVSLEHLNTALLMLAGEGATAMTGSAIVIDDGQSL